MHNIESVCLDFYSDCFTGTQCRDIWFEKGPSYGTWVRYNDLSPTESLYAICRIAASQSY